MFDIFVQTILFLTTYIPFWAIPAIFILVELFHIAKKREKHKYLATFVLLIIINSILVILYYVAGGPHKSADYVKRFFMDL